MNEKTGLSNQLNLIRKDRFFYGKKLLFFRLIRWKIRFFYVDFLDPVFIHLFDAEKHIVICDDDLIFFRQMI